MSDTPPQLAHPAANHTDNDEWEDRMRPSITLALLLGAALSASALACHDTGPASPQTALDNRAGSEGGDQGSGEEPGREQDDSSSTPPPPNVTEPATPGARPDTAVQHPPPLATTFTLHGIIRGAEPGPDTTRTVPLPGVTASLYRVRAADGTPVQPEVLVGSAVADGLSEVTFAGLASAYYRLDVKAPAGGSYLDASVTVVPPSAASIAVYVLLRRKD